MAEKIRDLGNGDELAVIARAFDLAREMTQRNG
jgi:hypothetical protein